MPRHELWRKQYRNRRYLNSLSDEAVLAHGAKLSSFMAPHFLKDGYRLPLKKSRNLWKDGLISWKEAKNQGIRFKKNAKTCLTRSIHPIATLRVISALHLSNRNIQHQNFSKSFVCVESVT